jgi:hypothetical protein
MSAEILYEHEQMVFLHLKILITTNSIIRNGKRIPISDIKKVISLKAHPARPRLYYVGIETGFFLKGEWALLYVDAIDDEMRFTENDQKQIHLLNRALDIARAG